MRAVNLLPSDTRSSRGVGGGRRLDPLMVGGAVLTVVIAAAVGGGFVLERSHASSEQRQLATARAELARLKAQEAQSGPKTPILATPAVAGQSAPWQAALDSALSTRVSYDEVLSQLALVAPARVTFSSMTLGAAAVTTTAAAVPGSAGALTLAGSAFDENGVAQLLARLELIPALTDVTLTSSTADPKSGVVAFVIAAQVKGVTTAFSAPPQGPGA